MATTGTADNNRSVISRVGNVNADVNVTDVGVGDNGMTKFWALGSASGTLVNNDDVKSRDSDNVLGNQGIGVNAINSQLTYTHTQVPATSGIRLDGTFIGGTSQTSTTLSADEAADDDGRSDAGSWYYKRSKTDTSNDFETKTG